MPRKSSTLEKPLEGAVLCCTSILPEDRTELAEYAQQMGAEHTLDLTSDVTHLIVGDTDSKKYQYVAKEREDVKVLRPEWIRAVRDGWMADQPIDLKALDAEYRLPTLFGLKICITGFEDLTFRNGFAHDIQKNGGFYTGDLTKDVTHLIACTASGKKYEYANLWQIKVVSVKWYKDTLERGMQLDETLYHPALPPDQQGIGAWNRKGASSPKLGKRVRDDEPKAEATRKIRRTASTKFNSQHQDIWTDIVGNNGPDPNAGQATEGAIKPTNSTIQPLSSNIEARPTSAPVNTTSNNKEASTGVLHGKHFATKGFDEKRKGLLFAALTGLDARVHDSVSDMGQQLDLTPNDRFLIVPYNIDPMHRKLIEQKSANTTLVTELWVEWCITMKQFVDPDTYILGRPVAPIALPAVSKMKINTTGFHQVQTMHISKIVSQLGAQYQEMFTPETSVLVCNSANVNPQKVVHATAWSVPIVTEKWLEQLVRQERVPLFEHFRILQKSNSTTNPNAMVGVSAPIRRVEDSFKSKDMSAGVDGPADRRTDRFDVAQDDQESQQPVHEQKTNAKPLQEISPNIQPKQAPQTKRKLFNSFDGMLDTENKRTPNLDNDADGAIMVDEDITDGVAKSTSKDINLQGHPDHEKHNDLIKEFLEIKAAAAAKLRETERRPSAGKLKEKKLLSRALSNLSNSSRTSNDNGRDDTVHQRRNLSRASSIHSNITDGLGVSLSNISRLPSDPKTLGVQNSGAEGSNKGPGAKSAIQQDTHTGLRSLRSNNHLENSKLSSFHAQLHTFTNSQPVRAASPPPLSQDQGQLTYADSAEAVKLRAQLAEKRRARAKLGESREKSAPALHTEESEEKRQQEWRERERKMGAGEVLRDNEAVIGGGRRTRGRDRALAGLDVGKNVEDEWGAGVLK